MKIFAVFLCGFLFLLFAGTTTYIYILWTSYWQQIAKYTSYEDSLKNNNIRNSKNFANFRHIGPPAPPDNTVQKPEVNSKNLVKSNDEEKERAELDLPLDKLMMHVRHYKTQIVSQLRSAVISTGKSVQSGEVKNIYNVDYQGRKATKLKPLKSPEQLVCSAWHQVRIQTFLHSNEFFKKHQLDEFLPKSILNLLQSNRNSSIGNQYNTCGVVSSAGSLLHSKLGKTIDANDFVIRFNAAPTEGFETDVGAKTSLRIINSQVVSDPSFKFLDESHLSPVQLFSKSPVLVWDPSGYNSSLDEWYGGGADFPFFQTYFSKRLMRPEDDVHLLDPQSLWSIWNWLQSQSKWPLLPNPPSSGFLGVVMAMLHCNKVHVYEYVPSMRLTKRCHYYDDNENLGCTIGDWHPLAAEKLLALGLNIGNDSEVFAQGFLTLPGLNSIHQQCSTNLTSSLDPTSSDSS